jgi:prolyl-tRNA editing enzyme YbaK/EbsC (Cys-tRNA(Pro) deacylase)
MQSTMTATLTAIRATLQERGVPFRELHHVATKTSEESAAVRGEPMEIGGKAILLKVDEQFALFVLPANRKLNSAAIRKELGVRKTRFATADELHEQTGLVPGSVPPFGRPILPFDLYVDSGIRSNDRIAFNAGSLTDSMIMSTGDYFPVAQPVKVFSFST